MADRLTKVLEVLDVGLQSSSDHGFGTDSAPGRCARCRTSDPVTDGDLCAACRSFLLEDTNDDPMVRNPNELLVMVSVDASTLLEQMSRVARQLAEARRARHRPDALPRCGARR
jgi:hypothetical protein